MRKFGFGIEFRHFCISFIPFTLHTVFVGIIFVTISGSEFIFDTGPFSVTGSIISGCTFPVKTEITVAFNTQTIAVVNFTVFNSHFLITSFEFLGHFTISFFLTFPFSSCIFSQSMRLISFCSFINIFSKITFFRSTVDTISIIIIIVSFKTEFGIFFVGVVGSIYGCSKHATY